MATNIDHSQALRERQRRIDAIKKLEALNKQLTQSYAPTIGMSSPVINNERRKPIAPPAPPPEVSGAFDAAAALTWNLFDSVTLGIPQAIFDTKYDFDNMQDMSGPVKFAAGAGQGLGFFVPMAGAAKVVSTPLKALKVVDKAADGSKVIRGISSADKIDDAVSTLTYADKVTDGMSSTRITEGLTDILKKDSKKFIKNYELSDEVIEGGEKLFGDNLSSNITKMFKEAGGEINPDDARKIADDVLKALKDGGKHHNRASEILFEKFGGHLDPGLKKKLVGYVAEVAEQFAAFTLYNATTGAVQEVKSRYKKGAEEYQYWEELGKTIPSALLYSAAAPLIDFIPGGKNKPITKDAIDVVKTLLAPKNTAKMSTEKANALLKIWSRYDSAATKAILGSKYTMRDLAKGLPDKEAQKILQKLWETGRRDLVKRFGAETKADIIGSLGRMSVDAVLFAGIDNYTQGSIISKAGIEDSYANWIIGAVMAKTRRPIAGQNFNLTSRYFDDNWDTGPAKYDEQMFLLESMGIDLGQAKSIIEAYDHSQYARRKGEAFLSNKKTQRVVQLFEEAEADTKGNTAASKGDVSQRHTVREAYRKIYLNAKIASSMDLGVLPKIDFTKMSEDRLDKLERDLAEISINVGEDGKPVSLKGNVTRLATEIIYESAESIHNEYTETLKDIAETLGIGYGEENGKTVFVRADVESIDPSLKELAHDYNSAVDMLVGASYKSKVKTELTLKRVALQGKDAQVAASKIKKAIEDSLSKLSQDHWGHEGKDLVWYDNDLINELHSAQNLRELNKLALLNMDELGEVKAGTPLAAIKAFFDTITGDSGESDLHFDNFVDGFIIVDKNDKTIDSLSAADAEKLIEAQQLISVVYKAFVSGKAKKKAGTGPKVKITADKALEVTSKIKETFSLLKDVEITDDLPAKIESYILSRKFEGKGIDAAKFGLVKRILDDQMLDLNDFPTEKAALEMVKSQLLQAGVKERSPEWIKAVDSVTKVFAEIKEMPGIFKFNENKVVTTSRDLKKRNESPINYIDEFNKLVDYTTEYYKSKIENDLVTFSRSMENAPKEIENFITLFHAKLTAITTDNDLFSKSDAPALLKEMVEGMIADLEDIKKKEILSDESADAVSEMLIRLRDVKLSDNFMSGRNEILNTIHSQGADNSTTLYERMQAVVQQDAKNKVNLVEAVQRIVYSGYTATNREATIRASEDLRNFLLKELFKDKTKDDNMTIIELLDLYNKTGDYADFKKWAQNKQYSYQKIWDPEVLRRMDDAFAEEMGYLAREAKGENHHQSPLSIIMKYGGADNPYYKNGKFDPDAAARISAAVEDTRSSDQATVAKGRSALRKELEAIKQAIRGSEYFKGLSSAEVAREWDRFVKKDLGPLVNALVNSYTTPSLTYVDGTFIMKNVTRIRSKADEFMDGMNRLITNDDGGLNALIELESTGIVDGRKVQMNTTTISDGKNSTSFDNYLSNTNITLIDERLVDAEMRESVGKGEQIQGLQPGKAQEKDLQGNSKIMRIGISNYKTLIFNMEESNKSALLKIFRQWYNNKLASGSLTDAQHAGLESLFSWIHQTDHDVNAMMHETSIRSMVRTMYYDSINANMMNDLYSQDSRSNYDKNLKFIKYVHIIEGAMTSSINIDALKFIRDEQASGSRHRRAMDEIIAKHEGRGIGTIVVQDEGKGQEWLNNAKFIERSLEAARNLHAQYGRTDMVTKIDDMIRRMKGKKKWGKYGAIKGAWESVGAEEVVSVLNGITFASENLNLTTSISRGIDATEGAEGTKPVIRHNDFSFDANDIGSSNGRTLVDKTMMVYDPEVARAMHYFKAIHAGEGWGDGPNDKSIDLITFKSAAKSFSGNMINSDIRAGNSVTSPMNSFTSKREAFLDMLDGNINAANDDSFYIGLDDIGLNYMTKPVHRSPIPPSLVGSLDATELSDFHEWIGFTGEGNKIDAAVGVFHGLEWHSTKRNATVQGLLASIEEQGLSLDDPSISTFNKLINAGLDASSPMVKYDILKLAKNNFVDTLKRPLSRFAFISPLVPSIEGEGGTLSNPIFSKNDTQLTAGGIKVSHGSLQELVGDVKKNLTLVIEDDDGTDITVGWDRNGNNSVLRRMDGEKIAAGRKAELSKFFKSFYEKLSTVEGELSYKEIYDMLDSFNRGGNTGGPSAPNAIAYRFDGDGPPLKLTNKFIHDDALTFNYTDNNGVQQNSRYRLHIAASGLRIPKQSRSDFVVNRIEDHFGEHEGNFVAVNAFELATKHQGDFDVDKLFYFTNTPISIINSAIRKSGEVIDPGIFESDLIKDDLNLFEVGEGERTAGSGVNKDGLVLHAERIQKAAMLLGRSVKLLTAIPTLDNLNIKLGGNEMTDNKKDLFSNIAKLISTAVDHHAGIAKFVLENDYETVLKWMMLGKTDFEKMGHHIFDKETLESLPKKHKDSMSLLQGTILDEGKLVELDIVSTLISEVGKFSRLFSGVWDDAGGRAPEIFEIQKMYSDARAFFKDPNAFIFKKLAYKYGQFSKSDEKRNSDLAALINYFFEVNNRPGEAGKNKKFIDQILKGEIDDVMLSLAGKSHSNYSNAERSAILSFPGDVSDATIDKMFDKSPALKVLKGLGKAGILEAPLPGGFSPGLGEHSRKVVNKIVTHRLFTDESNFESLVYFKGQGSGQEGLSKLNLGDLQQRSAFLKILEMEYDNAAKSYKHALENNHSSEEDINKARVKLNAIAHTQVKTNELINEGVRDLVKDINEKTQVIKKKNYFKNFEDNTVYLYKKSMSKIDYKKDPLSALEPAGVVKSKEGMNLSEYHTYIVLKKPLVETPVDGQLERDGLAWFLAVDPMADFSSMKNKDEISRVYELVEKFRRSYNEKMKKANERRGENLAQNVYGEVKLQLKNEFSNLYKQIAGDENTLLGGTKKITRMRFLISALLKPRVGFGKGTLAGDIKLPKFNQDQKFAKEVLGYMLEGDNDLVREITNVVRAQGQIVRYLGDATRIDRDTISNIKYKASRSNYFRTKFEYDKNSVIPSKEGDFYRSLVWDTFDTPAAVLMNIDAKHPEITNFMTRRKIKNVGGQVYVELEKIRDLSDFHKEANKEPDLLEALCIQ